MEIGFHHSISPSIADVPQKARDIGAGTFQIFTRSNRQWKSIPLKEDIILQFQDNYNKLNFETSVIHLPYLPNFAASDGDIKEKSLQSLKQEVQRAQQLGIPLIVLHLGSHKGEGDQSGIQNFVTAIEEVIPQLDSTSLNFETSAGHKHSIGKTFEELNLILEKLSDTSKIGICMDTAHIFAANYDIRTEDCVIKTFEQFDNVIGLNKLQVVHLNDSKAELGSRLDRHEHIGKGKIGKNGFKFIMEELSLLNIPVILETPKSETYGDSQNFEVVQSLLRDK